MKLCNIFLLVGCLAGWSSIGEAAKPIRRLTYDENAAVVDLLSEAARNKLTVRVIPQSEFLARILIENLTDEPLTVRLPKAIAAVHTLPDKEVDAVNRVRVPAGEEIDPSEKLPLGNGQAIVGTFGPMIEAANGFPLKSAAGDGFTIPAGKSVQIVLHSACAEHGKLSPFSRMTYTLKPLAKQIENDTLKKIVQTYDPAKTDPLAFQAIVWHLANDMPWQDLVQKTVKRGGQQVPYFTRAQLTEAQRLLQEAQSAE